MAQQRGDVGVGEREPDRVGDAQQRLAVAEALVERIGVVAKGGRHRLEEEIVGQRGRARELAHGNAPCATRYNTVSSCIVVDFPPMSRVRTRPTRDETREKLFQAAAEVFEAQGIGAASIEMIASEAGLT